MSRNHVMQGSRSLWHVIGLALLGSLAACAPVTPPATVSAEPRPAACTPAAAGDPLVGNWLSVASQRGLAGALRTLYTLGPDGKMTYVEQVKRPRAPSQGLQETGCWSHEGHTLILRTLVSNGSPVNLNDPIYTNRFTITRTSSTELHMRGPDGLVQARRMSPGYRLPF